MSLDLGRILDRVSGITGDAVKTFGTRVRVTRPSAPTGSAVDPHTLRPLAEADDDTIGTWPVVFSHDNRQTPVHGMPATPAPAETTATLQFPGQVGAEIRVGDHLTVVTSRDRRLIGTRWGIADIADSGHGLLTTATVRPL